MIPEFDERGYLPSGIHRATIEEIGFRFGNVSELRRSQFESLCWLIELAKQAGIKRVILNGSFTTEEYEPNDVDCVLLIERDGQLDSVGLKPILDGLPFLDIEVVTERGFRYLTDTVFATDRRQRPKGMIEVML